MQVDNWATQFDIYFVMILWVHSLNSTRTLSGRGNEACEIGLIIKYNVDSTTLEHGST